MFNVCRVTAPIIVLVGLLLSACGGESANGVSPRPNTGTSPDPTIDAAVISSTPEPARRATGTIGVLGGRVETVGADGTAYELFVPPGALPGDTEISVTPTTVTGLEDVAHATRYAVEFQPSGLTFLTPATLTVRPPAGSPVAPDDFVFSWEDGTTGVSIGPIHVAADGSFRIEVPHFSGVGTLAARVDAYQDMAARALATLSELEESTLGQRVANLLRGVSGAEQAVVNELMRIYNTQVLPALNQADQGVVQTQIAATRLVQFEQIFVYAPIGQLPVAGSAPGRTLESVRQEAHDLFLAEANALLASYQPPQCNAAALDLADWFVAPILLVAEISRFTGQERVSTFCARAVVETLEFPTELNPEEQFLDVSFRGAISAPAQTPGGTVVGNSALFPQPTLFRLNLRGASMLSGVTDLYEPTDASGILSLQLDRGADEAARAPRVTVEGTAQVAGLMADVSRLLSVTEEFIPIQASAALPAVVNVRFRSPPVNRILTPGETTDLCVDVFNREDRLLPGVTVIWDRNGPGDLAATTSVTDVNGRACMNYTHPAGVVIRGSSVTVSATANVDGTEGRDEVLLTPRWAALALEVRAESDAAFRPATNAQIPIVDGQRMVLRLSLVGPGSTPADPEIPIALDQVRVQVESGGGGTLETPLGATGTDLALTTNETGHAELTWDPSGSTGGATLRVSYPLTGAGIAATVALTTAASNDIRITGAGVTTSYTMGVMPPFQLPTFSLTDSQTVDLVASGLTSGQASVADSGSFFYDDPNPFTVWSSSYNFQSQATQNLSGARPVSGALSGLNGGTLAIDTRCELPLPEQPVGTSNSVNVVSMVPSTYSASDVQFDVGGGRFMLSGTATGSASADASIVIRVSAETSMDTDGASAIVDLSFSRRSGQTTAFSTEIVGTGRISISGSAICSTDSLGRLILESNAAGSVTFTLTPIQ